MILSLNFQAKLFLTTVLWGFGLAFFYDLIRVLRIAIKHKKLFIALEDGLYWIIVSLTIFFVMLSESFGEVRLFCVVGVFIGMILYFIVLSNLFLGVSEIVIKIIKKVICVFLEIIMTPFMIVYKIFYHPAKKTYNFANKMWKKLLHLCKICVKIYVHRFRNELGILHKKRISGVAKDEKEG